MLSEKELERYERQIMFFAAEGKVKLQKARIFIAGAGGLGSSVSLYLTAAEICDGDTLAIFPLMGGG